MQKKGTETTNIYELQIKNRNAHILKAIGGLAILLTIFDFFVLETLDKNYYLSIYGILFRVFILSMYLLYSPTLYQFYKYFSLILGAIILPTILLATYIYLELFGTIWTLAIWLTYGILLRLVYIDIQNTEIDYEKSAKNLLKIYPNPYTMEKFNYHGVVKKKKEVSKSNNIFISIFSHVPIWVLFAFPLVSAEIAVAYLSTNIIGAAIMGMELLLCIIFMYAGFASLSELGTFHEAQKILDKQKRHFR